MNFAKRADKVLYLIAKILERCIQIRTDCFTCFARETPFNAIYFVIHLIFYTHALFKGCQIVKLNLNSKINPTF